MTVLYHYSLISKIYRFNQLDNSPLHVDSFVSGSHSLFSIQVDAFDPVSVSPDGQLKVTVVPSKAGFLSPSTLTGLSEASW